MTAVGGHALGPRELTVTYTAIVQDGVQGLASKCLITERVVPLHALSWWDTDTPVDLVFLVGMGTVREITGRNQGETLHEGGFVRFDGGTVVDVRHEVGAARGVGARRRHLGSK